MLQSGREKWIFENAESLRNSLQGLKFFNSRSDKNTKKEYKYTVGKVYVGDRSSAIKYMYYYM